MDNWSPTDPEVQSIEAFAEYLADDMRNAFTGAELQILNANLRIPVKTIRLELESYGFKLAHRPKKRHIRGVTTNSHDRYYGPGSAPMHGGSGWEQIAGSAGQEG